MWKSPLGPIHSPITLAIDTAMIQSPEGRKGRGRPRRDTTDSQDSNDQDLEELPTKRARVSGPVSILCSVINIAESASALIRESRQTSEAHLQDLLAMEESLSKFLLGIAPSESTSGARPQSASPLPRVAPKHKTPYELRSATPSDAATPTMSLRNQKQSTGAASATAASRGQVPANSEALLEEFYKHSDEET
jgi:hypothetical protein